MQNQRHEIATASRRLSSSFHEALASAFEFSVANFKLVGELLTLIAFVLQAVDELRHETAKSLDFLLDGRHALLGRG